MIVVIYVIDYIGSVDRSVESFSLFTNPGSPNFLVLTISTDFVFKLFRSPGSPGIDRVPHLSPEVYNPLAITETRKIIGEGVGRTISS